MTRISTLRRSGRTLLFACTLLAGVAPFASAGASASKKPVVPRSHYDRHYPVQGGGWGPKAGVYWRVPWVNDWSGVPREDLRGLNRLKNIPVFGNPALRLSIDGQERFWFNTENTPGLKTGVPGGDIALLRTEIGANLDIDQVGRVYVQLANGTAVGRNVGDFKPNQRNDAILLQAFGEVRGQVLDGTVGAMVGRMQFWDGPIQLMAGRDRVNIQSPWNGIRAYGLWNRFRVDVFRFDGIAFDRHPFEDRTNGTEQLQGAVVGTDPLIVSGKPALYTDAFYYDYRVRRAWGGTTGDDHRRIYGVYVHGAIGRLHLNASGAREIGRFGMRPVTADGVFVKAGYLLVKSRYQPRFGVTYDRTSGGGAYGTGTLHDFNDIHGGARLILQSNALSYTNARIVGPEFSFRPLPKIRVSLRADRVDRVAAGDAVYSASASIPYAGTEKVPGRRVGTLYSVSMAWQINLRLVWNVYLQRLAAGPVLRRAGYGNQDVALGILTFRF